MGIVYLAKREKDFERNVAIKVIRREHLTDKFIDRFRHETNIQAKIGAHPNIVSLLDAGVTETGEPFFVMDYVDGQTLREHLQESDISVDEKLDLFQKILRGIAFAHQNAIIHRDIKPSNILVGRDGNPKVIDFGLAKLVDHQNEHRTATLAMTPMYASPEQVVGKTVTTSSDIYSLGVVLYEMLTGVSPYENSDRGIQELVSSVANDQPKPPSHRIRELPLSDTVHAHRESTLNTKSLRSIKRTEKRVSGDLDQIVLKALRKEPKRRYQTVIEFADDISSFLENRPVIARPDSFLYRTQKFISRNKLAVAAALLLFVSMLAGMIGTASGWRSAFNERTKLELEQKLLKEEQAKLKSANKQIANNLLQLKKSSTLNRETIFDFMTEVSNDPALRETPATRKLRTKLYERAAEKFESMVSLFAADDDQFELARIYYWLGYINHDFGNDVESDEHYKSSKDILEGLLADSPEDLKLVSMLGTVLNEHASQLRTMEGRLDDSIELAEKAIEIRDNLVDKHSEDLEYHKQLLRSLGNLCTMLRNKDRLKEAEEITDELLIRSAAAMKLDPKDPEVQLLTSRAHFSRGSNHYINRNYKSAQTEFEKARDLIEPAAKANPSNLFYKWQFANSLYHIGFMQRIRRQVIPAMNSYLQALPLAKEMAEAQPDKVANLQAVANIQNGIGATYLTTHQDEKAITHLADAAQAYRKLLKVAPKRSDFQQALQGCLTNLSYSYRRIAEFDQAIAAAKDAIEIGERLVANNPSIMLGVQVVAAKGSLAGLQKDTGKWSDSKATYLDAIEVGTKLSESYPNNPMPQLAHVANVINYAGALVDNQEEQLAIPLFDSSIEVLKKLTKAERPAPQAISFLRNAFIGRARARFWTKDYGPSVDDYESALAIESRFSIDQVIELATSNFALGNESEAIETIEKTIASRPGDSSVSFYATTFFSIAAERTDDKKQKDQFVSRAIEMLVESDKDGYARKKNSMDVLQQNRRLKFLRKRPEFTKWLQSQE